MILTLTSCSMSFFKKDLPSTPISVPIDISKKGNKVEIDFKLKPYKKSLPCYPLNTAFEIEFLYKDPRYDKNSKYYVNPVRNFLMDIGALEKYFEIKYTEEEWAEIMQDDHRIIKLVGGWVPENPGNPFSKKIVYPGIQLPKIHLTILDLNNYQKVVFDDILEITKHPEIAGYFDKFLSRIRLVPGNYKAIAVVESDANEFAGTEIKLGIGYSRGKY